MLESVLEQLFLRYATPYVDGISKDKLRVGILAGSLELRDLRVKPDALALLGLEGFRVRNGAIKFVKVSIPWTRLYSGKLRAVLQDIHLEVEQIAESWSPERAAGGLDTAAELAEEIRDMKRKAIELRVNQLSDLLEQQEQLVNGNSEMGMKLLRKIVNNIQIELADAVVSLVSDRHRLTIRAQLPALQVLSTDQTFREMLPSEEVIVSGCAMYKLLRAQGLGLSISHVDGNTSSTEESCGCIGLEKTGGVGAKILRTTTAPDTATDYVLSPIDAQLKLAHVPRDQSLRARLEVATHEIAELTLSRSQVKHLKVVQATSWAEAESLRQMMIPPDSERTILSDLAAANSEYGSFYERYLLHQWGLAGRKDRPLNPDENARMRLLEDVLSVRLLARERWKIRSKLEELSKEQARRVQDIERARAQEGQRRAGLLKRVAGAIASGPAASAVAGEQNRTLTGAVWLTPEEQEQLLQDLNDESKVESVDLPLRLNFEFSLGKVALDLVDDRWHDGPRRQLLSLSLQDADLAIDVKLTDHQGMDLAEWRVDCRLSTFRAIHGGRIVFRFCPSAHTAEKGDPDATRTSSWLGGGCATRMELASTLENDGRNLLGFRVEFAPLELHALPGVLEHLLEFARGPALQVQHLPFVNASGAESSSSHEVKQVATRVVEQLPNRFHIDIRLTSTVVHVPIDDLGVATFSLGQFYLGTPESCEYSGVKIDISFLRTAVRAIASSGERFNIIEPAQINMSVQYENSPQETAVDLQIMLEHTKITLAPQALRILLATPSVLIAAAALPEAEATSVALLTQRASEFVWEVFEPDASVSLPCDGVHGSQFRILLSVHLANLDVTLTDSLTPVAILRMGAPLPGFRLYQQRSPYIFSCDVDQSTIELDVFDCYKRAWEPAVERFCFGFQVTITPEGENGLATRAVLTGQDPLLVNLTPSNLQIVRNIIPRFIDAVFKEEAHVSNDEFGNAASSGGGSKYRVINLCEYPLEIEFLSPHSRNLVLQVKPTGSRWEPLDDWVLPHFSTALLVRLPGGQHSTPLPIDQPGAAVDVPGSGVVAELCAPNLTQRLLLLAAPVRVHNQTDLGLLLRFHDAVQREVLMVDVPSTAVCEAVHLGKPPPTGKTQCEYAASDTCRGNTHSSALSPPEDFRQPLVDPSSSTRSLSSSSSAPAPTSQFETLLPPHSVCNIPAIALARVRSGSGVASAGLSRSWLSIRPAGFQVDFCKAVEMGSGTPARLVTCPNRIEKSCAIKDASLSRERQHETECGNNAAFARRFHALTRASENISAGDRAHDLNFLLAAEDYAFTHVTPEYASGIQQQCATSLVTIAIRPSLTLINALPSMGVEVGYAAVDAESQTASPQWREVSIPPLTRLNLYSCAYVPMDGIHLRTRFLPRACESSLTSKPTPEADRSSQTIQPPWSEAVRLGRCSEGLSRSTAEATGDHVLGGTQREFTMSVRQSANGAACTLVVDPIAISEIRISCPRWLADRSGLMLPLSVEVCRDGRNLPTSGGLTLLPADCLDGVFDLVLKSSRSACACQRTQLPPSWTALPWKTPCGAFVFCLQTDDVLPRDLFGAHCQVTTLRPRLVLMNASSSADLELRLPGGRLILLGVGQSLEVHWQVSPDDEALPATSLRFRPLRDPPCTWSGLAGCGEASAGSTPFLLCSDVGAKQTAHPSSPNAQKAYATSGKPEASASVLDGFCRPRGLETWSVEVAPSRGALAVTFQEGSNFVAVNNARIANVTMIVRPLSQGTGSGDSGVGSATAMDVFVDPGAEVPYGWAHVRHGERGRAVDVFIGRHRCRITDVRRTCRRPLHGLGAVLAVTRAGTRTLLILEDACSTKSESHLESVIEKDRAINNCKAASMMRRFEIKLAQLGLSLIEGLPQPREIMYIHLDLIRFEWRQREDDTQEIQVAISDVQVDCQLPDRVDARTMDRRRQESLGLLRRERPAVIVANCARGDRAFLNLYVRRAATSSQDLVLQNVEIAFDALDVTIDDEWLEPFMSFLSTCSVNSIADSGCLELDSVLATAGRPIPQEYVPPTLPPIVQVDSMQVSSVQLTVWCALKLRSVRFLPAYIRTAIRVLSLSGNFTLDGASLTLAPRTLPPHLGSLGDFARGLANEYAVALLRNTGAVLGKSSILNVPRLPLSVGGAAVSYVTGSLGLVAGEAASLLGQLTFDEEYMAQQRRIRNGKQIRGLKDGVAEASKSLAQGVESIVEAVRQPDEGTKHRIDGLFSSVGHSVASGLMKPISKFGQAISDVGTGIAAHATPDSASKKRRRARLRQRLPRLLFSPFGVVRPWSAFEAEIVAQLGPQLTFGVEEIVALTLHGSSRVVLLLFGHHLLVVQISASSFSATSQHVQVGAIPQHSAVSSVGADTRLQITDVPATQQPSRDVTSERLDSQVNSTLASGAGSSQVSRNNGNHQSSIETLLLAQTSAIANMGNLQRSPDIVDALEETAFKLFLQALKPINTVVYGFQDVERKLAARGSSNSSNGKQDNMQEREKDAAAAAHRACKLRFADLSAVHISEDGNVIDLEDKQGNTISLPLFAADLDSDARMALANGLQSALHGATKPAVGSVSDVGDSVAVSWKAFSMALATQRHAECRRNVPSPGVSRYRGDGGSHATSNATVDKRKKSAKLGDSGLRTLEVFEVERRVLGTATWHTPFLPTDGELSWRWVDATGCRHPHLLPGLTREGAASPSMYPPCHLEHALFHSVSEWSLERSQGVTDNEGWVYGVAWNASTWDPQPGLLDALRRRRWTRTFS